MKSILAILLAMSASISYARNVRIDCHLGEDKSIILDAFMRGKLPPIISKLIVNGIEQDDFKIHLKSFHFNGRDLKLKVNFGRELMDYITLDIEDWNSGYLTDGRATFVQHDDIIVHDEIEMNCTAKFL